MNKLLNRVSTLLLMLLATIPMVHLVIYSFCLDVDQRLPLFLTVAVLLCWLMFSLLTYRLPGLLLSGGLAFLFIHSRREILAEQFTDILDRISATYYDRFTSGAYELIFESGDHTEAMLIFGFIFTALLGMALSSREDRVFLSLLVSVPILLLCLLVYGLIPGWIMLCLTLFIVMLICTGRLNRPEGSLGKSFFVLFLPVVLILGVLLIFKGPDKYDNTQQDLSFVKQVQAFTGKLSAMIGSDADAPPRVNERSPVTLDSEDPFESSQNQWSGSGSTLDASAPSSLAELNDTLMYVTAEQSGRIYLRHNSYGAYTGTGWAAAPVYPGAALTAFSAKAVAGSGNAVNEKLSIRLAAADASLLYVPYYTDMAYTSDAGISGGENEYSLSYMRYDAGYRSLPLPPEFQDTELSYRQFVYSNYLSLPDSTADALLSIADENSLRLDDRLESVSAVAGYVRNSAEYDIDTQPYPSGDYAVYLLTEAESGYCVHFATAATAMFRAIGIPARLVTGVAFDAEAGRSVEVLRENEHAWVEVYIDGTGWLPVEVTPGSIDSEAPGTEPPQPEAASPKPSPAPIPTPGNSGGENSVSIVQKETQNKLAETLKAAKPVITATGCVLLLPLLCLLWYHVRRWLWKRQLSGDVDKAALCIWRCAKRICGFGAEMPESIEQSAQRAFYGRGLGSKELSGLRKELAALRERSYAALPWYRKIIFKYVYGLK